MSIEKWWEWTRALIDYRDYFIEQFTKSDDNNPNDFSIIGRLQTILSQNEYKIAFDCLIISVMMINKFFFYQTNFDWQ